MCEGGGDGFFDDGFVGGEGFDAVADGVFEVSVVDVDVFCAVLFEAFDVFGGEGGGEGGCGHGEEDEPALGDVFGLEFAVGDYFFVAEEVEACESVAFVV